MTSPQGPYGWTESLKFWNNTSGLRDSLKNAERKIEPSRQFESNLWQMNERFEEDQNGKDITCKKTFYIRICWKRKRL